MTHVSPLPDSSSIEDPAIQNPSLDYIVKDYCGITISELVKKNDLEYETVLLWTEMKTKPTTLEKIIVEMLHLAYTKGDEL